MYTLVLCPREHCLQCKNANAACVQPYVSIKTHACAHFSANVSCRIAVGHGRATCTLKVSAPPRTPTQASRLLGFRSLGPSCQLLLGLPASPGSVSHRLPRQTSCEAASEAG